jgi:hypothetical protein
MKRVWIYFSCHALNAIPIGMSNRITPKMSGTMPHIAVAAAPLAVAFAPVVMLVTVEFMMLDIARPRTSKIIPAMKDTNIPL